MWSMMLNDVGYERDGHGELDPDASERGLRGGGESLLTALLREEEERKLWAHE